MATPMLPVLIAIAHKRSRDVLDAFRAAGAVGPAGALPLDALPPVDPNVLAWLVDRGLVREAAPGTFYAYEPPPGRGPGRTAVKLVLFLLVVVLIPVLLLQLTTAGAR